MRGVLFQVATCDVKGKARQFERDLLFSKVARVADLAKHLCEATKVWSRAAVAVTGRRWHIVGHCP